MSPLHCMWSCETERMLRSIHAKVNLDLAPVLPTFIGQKVLVRAYGENPVQLFRAQLLMVNYGSYLFHTMVINFEKGMSLLYHFQNNSRTLEV